MATEFSATGSVFPRLLGTCGGDTAGPLVIGIGGMHGNEPAGALALQQVLLALQSVDVPFRGTLVGLSGNRAALARDCRYIDEDFNRAWSQERVRRLRDRRPSADATSEEREQRELLAALDAQLAQRQGPVVCLDLHTTSAEGTPFVVIGDTLLNRRFAFRLRAPVVLGLEERLESTILNHLGEAGHVAVGFEGGQHDSPSAVAIHMAAIRTVLATAGCIQPEDLPLPEDPSDPRTDAVPAVVEVRYHHMIREGDDFVMDRVRELPAGRAWRNPGPRPPGTDPRRRGRTDSHAALSGTGHRWVFLVRRVRPFWLRVARWLRRLRIERLLPALPGCEDPRTSPGHWWSTHALPVGSCSNCSTCWAFANGSPGKGN